MRVLITGDQGFIGSHLRKAYRKQNADVYGWDKKGISDNEKTVYPADMMDMDDAIRFLKKISPDMIIHCAGSADVMRSIEEPIADMRVNYMATESLLFALKKCGMADRRFMLLSSASVYGEPSMLPMDEMQPINPLSPYALHKWAAEEACVFMHKCHGMDVKILRIFSAYGPGLRKQLFWDMYQKIKNTGMLELWGSGEESRDYIYVDDLVRAVMLIADRAKKDDIYFNVANGEEVTIRGAALCFVEHMHVSKEMIKFVGKRREGEPINWKADITRLQRLGYSRSVSFSEGIERYIQWADRSCG